MRKIQKVLSYILLLSAVCALYACSAQKKLNRIKNDTDRTLTYSLTENGIKISILGANESSFVLPLIAGELELLCGQADRCEEIFFLTGGFIAKEYTIIPDKDGRIELMIR
jgi:hypothetical protein